MMRLMLAVVTLSAGLIPAPILAAQSEVKTETIAILPWRLADGTDGAKVAARDFLNEMMTKAKVEVISPARAQNAWKEANGGDYDAESPKLPTDAQLLRMGQKLGVDWVMAGSAEWHSRSIWVSLGPKTKSTCTISVRLVDVAAQTMALSVDKLQMDSTAKEDTLKALGTVFISGLFTMVSGGPKTPHEVRAVKLGMAKALEPWLVKHLSVAKIDTRGK